MLALALSVGLCPLVTVLGIPLSLFALADIKRNDRRGRRVAIAALWISLISTPITGTFAWWWNANVRTALLDGPVAALRAGQQGDVAAFLEGLGGAGGHASETQAVAFLSSVSHRWGTVQSMRQTPEQPDVQAPIGAWWVGYDVLFERGAALGRAKYVLQSPQGTYVLAFQALVLTAEDGIELRWPPVAEGPQ